ncbi:PBP1A family penicillin-binding protein [Carnobacterium sp. TMP28]|uniref:PBP1A family penicillin-binding protein n=1 Tax=Carnobacterium sp. TMP28 TaxID=3397060 RepID=UPI0039E1AB80
MNSKIFFKKIVFYLTVLWQKVKPYLTRFKIRFKRVWKKTHATKMMILAFLLVSLFSSGYLLYLAKNSNVSRLKAGLEQTTTVYDSDDDEAGTLYSHKGSFIALDTISPSIQATVISTEDKRFYDHTGFDIIGIARSAVGFVLNGGKISGGGSTISQQLAKNAYLTLDQTLIRKLKELFLAIEIEKYYTKSEILEMYLNNAYFGNGVWGVEDASHKYFGKNASDVSLTEAATIAGMLKAPTTYNPRDNIEKSISRRNIVLDLLVKNEGVSKEIGEAAKNESLQLMDDYQQTRGYQYPYYFDAVIEEAITKYGLKEEELLNKGYKIYTSLDQNYQSRMDQTYENDWLFSDASDGTLVQSGSVAMDPKTGGVYAIVGGRGEHTFRGFNRATQIKRQPGSIMKPLAVYTPALESGYAIDSILKDEKIAYGSDKYTPENYDFNYSGEVPMYQALAQSLNAPAVWLLDQIGLEKGIKKVEKFGIPVQEKDKYLGLALGGTTGGVSPFQMASAYTAFSNAGLRSEGFFITKIVDATGAIIIDNTEHKTKKVTSPEIAEKMTSMLMGVFTSGTASSNAPEGYEIAGKTGSTEVSFNHSGGTTDQWTVGYTPDIVVATWIGFDQTDENHYMGTGSSTGVGPLFKVQMQNILPKTPQTAFGTKSAEVIIDLQEENSTAQWGEDFQQSVTQWGEQFKEGLDQLRDKTNSLIERFKNR